MHSLEAENAIWNLTQNFTLSEWKGKKIVTEEGVTAAQEGESL